MSATRTWHATPVTEIGTALETDLARGLRAEEASGRLAREGRNELRRGEAVSPWAIFAGQFSSLVIWVLIGAAIVSALLGEFVDGVAIIVHRMDRPGLTATHHARGSQARASRGQGRSRGRRRKQGRRRDDTSMKKLLILTGAATVLLASVPARGAGPDVGRGKSTYGELCAKCHGSSGKGDGKEAATLATKPKDLTDCKRMSGFTAEQLFKIIKEGGSAGGLSKDMPSYTDSLEDDEIRDVLAFTRGLCRP